MARRRWLTEARPIALPRAEVASLVDRLILAMSRLPGDPKAPLGASKKSLVRDKIALQTVLGGVTEVVVILTATTSRASSWVLGGGSGHLKRGAQKGAPVVVVELNGKYPRESFGNKELMRRELTPVLMHELTHAADVPTKSVSPIQGRIPKEGEVDPVAYYNTPQEVRAYARELFELLRPLVQKIMASSLGKTWGLGGTIERMLKNNETWVQISPHLTSKNRKYVLKTLVTAFQDELRTTEEFEPQLEKAKPDWSESFRVRAAFMSAILELAVTCPPTPKTSGD